MRERRNWWVFMACWVLLVACNSEPQRVEYVGRVIDAETLRPVRDAQASFSFVGAPPVEYTDSNGVYTFLVPIESEPVRGRIAILADGYEPFVLNVSLRKDTLTIEDVRLTLLLASETTLLTETVVVEVAEANPQPEADAAEQTPRSPTPTPSPQAGDPWVRTKDNMTMRFVPGGTFTMGSEDGEADEGPLHDVTLNPFWIDQTEVTNFQYAQCVQVGECERSEYVTDANYNRAQQPVVGVSWYDAEAYCAWAEARLPTEAEWEYAARGPEERTYPWGEAQPTCAFANFFFGNHCEGQAIEVQSYSPESDSWVGAQDMAGNVWEWVSDWYDPTYYANFIAYNPTGPSNGSEKILRGGSWDSNTSNLRSANRYLNLPGARNVNVGFRCVHPGP